MTKLIVNTPEGIQELIEVGYGGGYFDLSLVVWDERSHGKLSDATLSQVGGLVRSGNQVQFDSSRLAANEAKKTAKAAKEQEAVKDTADRRARIKNIKSANSVSELRQVVQDLVDHLGLGGS
jgi:hypothetical protein